MIGFEPVPSLVRAGAPRCAGCGVRAPRPSRRTGWLRCTWCKLLVRRTAWGRPLDLSKAFRPGFATLRGADWIADPRAAPDLASAFRLDLREMRPADGGEAARGLLAPLQAGPPRSITLAVISRAGDERLAGLVEHYRPFFREVVVVVDTPEPAAVPLGARVLAHPLDGDFAAQRNRLQEVVRTRWVLHLDTDEMLTPMALATLAAAARVADRRCVRAVALPRVNLVDGRPSDLFPDVQYRLVRASERFENRVHERVKACREERLTAVSRAGAIVHHIDRAHVVARTRTYERLGQHRDRLADEEALLRRFRGRPPAGWTTIPPH